MLKTYIYMEMCIYTWTCLYIYIHTYHTYVENMRLNHKQIDENQQTLDSNQRKNDKKHGEPIKTMDKSMRTMERQRNPWNHRSKPSRPR